MPKDNRFTQQAKLQAFPPLVGPKPQVLILGSMPGRRSLQLQQYYGFPQNAFWRIMADLFEVDLPTYEDRKDLIASKPLALWDVLKACHRPGTSSDSAIHEEEANDFASFFWQHPGIHTLVFNGKSPKRLYDKRVGDNFQRRVEVFSSTSPQYAAMRYEEKLEHWRELLSLLRE